MSTETPRCSEFARAIDVLPPGTGLFLTRVFLVSLPLPWPKPALKHPLIEKAASYVMASSVPSRLFAAEPLHAESGPADPQQTLVEVFERHDGIVRQYRWGVASGDAIGELVQAVTVAAPGLIHQVIVAGANPHHPVAANQPVQPVQPGNGVVPIALAPTFLICTQGSHDLCCGTSGVALADQIERERPEYVVRRVSHTGGHRFSPTLLHLPEGRMWAFVDLDLVDRIANGTTTAQDHRSHGRGWWGAKVGPAQVAENAVRVELAGSTFVEPVIEPLNAVEGRSATEFAVTVGHETWRVTVSVGREVPTIACESPGGLPVKPGREFAWTIERQ